jgi:outer membrane immunogenic protein
MDFPSLWPTRNSRASIRMVLIGHRFGEVLMKTVAIGFAAITALIGTSALAADMPMPMKAPYSPPAAYSWSGCYIGVNGGGARSENFWEPVGGVDLGTTSPNGFFGGGQVGCDYQTGPWVFGVEGQFDWVGAKNSALAQSAAAATEMATKLKMFGTVEGRVGYAFNRVLPYVKGGLAGARFWQELDATTATTITPVLGGNENVLGIAGGAGFEVALLTNLSFMMEYNYIHLGTNGAPISCIDPAACAGTPTLGLDIKQNIQAVMFGMNYRFGLGPMGN